MRVLILLAYDRYTGVTTWASDLAEGLDADILMWLAGEPTKRLQYKNKRVLSEFPEFNDYDVIIVSYGVHMPLLTTYTGKVIYVVHGQGVYAGHYALPSGSRTPDVVVGVSHTIKWATMTDYTIPHGVNTDLFHPGDDVIEYPYLWHCRMQLPAGLKVLLGSDVVQVPECSPEEMAVHLRKARYVIAAGRSALEAVASGKHVFIWSGAEGNIHSEKYGGRYDGWLTTSNFRELQQTNFNGNVTCSVFDDVGDIQRALAQVPTALVQQDVSTSAMVQAFKDIL